MTLPVGSIRPGGRTARTRLAVLQATRQEVLLHGYGATSIERIARRAGVHKTTIYRRWQDRTRLVADVIGSMADATVIVADTGSVDQDLRLFARDLRTLLTGDRGRLIAGMLAAAQHDDVLAARIGGILDVRYAATSAIVTRAIARGELPTGTDPGAVIQYVAAPLYYARLVRGEDPTPHAADLSARTVLIAARAGVFISSGWPGRVPN